MILRAAIVATSLILMPVQAEDTPAGDTRTATMSLNKLRSLLNTLQAQELRIEELEWAIEKLKAQKDCA